jgi:hypothetical protein
MNLIPAWSRKILILLILPAGCQSGLKAGGAPPEVVFIFSAHPDLPVERYVDGELQIFLPSYSTTYLYIAYRHLLDAPLSQPAKDAFLRRAASAGPAARGVDVWLEQRRQVPGAEAQQDHFLQVYRSVEHQYYLNCHDEAFWEAARTLDQRVLRFGLDSTAVRVWLEGQDQVFQNCSGGSVLPEPLGSSYPDIIRKDRVYQIAAAHFYAAQFDSARQMFLEISGDPSSPWQQWGEYLAARALIRKATLWSEDAEEERRLFEQASRELEGIARREDLSNLHDSARGLLSFLKLRLQPEAMLVQLGRNLLEGRITGKSLDQDLTDYFWLIQKQTQGEDPFTIWLRSFQRLRPLDETLSRWRQERSLVWLAAVLQVIPPEYDGIAEQLQAAAEVDVESPAFLFVAFHRARLLRGQGEFSQARALLDSLLGSAAPPIAPSSRNLLKALRMAMATTLEEWAQLAVRNPVRLAHVRPYDRLWRHEDSAGWDQTSERFFDVDAATQSTAGIPLEILIRLLEAGLWEPHLQAQLAQSAWVKAVLLGRLSAAERMVPHLRHHFPTLDPHLRTFETEQRAEHKRFAAWFLVAKFPGFHPWVPAGPLRPTDFHRIDNMRYNWWCRLDSLYRRHVSPLTIIYGETIPSPHFLSEEDQQAARQEWEILGTLETAPNLLGAQIVEYARQFRSDPRVPEGLHRVVRATRYGCTDSDTGEHSRSAFRLLHRNYPNSYWAHQTPYWFR